MSTTATITALEPPAGSTGVHGTFKFTDPDDSVPASDRAFGSVPATKDWETVSLPLYDYRTDNSMVGKGTLYGVDVNGFTVVNHDAALKHEEWFDTDNIRNLYFPQIKEVVQNLTGAKSVVCVNAAVRCKLATKQQDPNYYRKKDEPDSLDTLIKEGKVEIKGALVNGASRNLEPVRPTHCDYTFEGSSRLVRFQNMPLIKQHGAEVIAALEQAERTGEPYNGPRFASYSLWRPLSPPKRDPLAVAKWGSIPRRDYRPFEYRFPTEGGHGEFNLEAYLVRPATDADGKKDQKAYAEHKWYWLPEQRPDELLVIKLSDSEAEKDETCCPGTAHASPMIRGTEDELPRESIETRVFAFW